MYFLNRKYVNHYSQPPHPPYNRRKWKEIQQGKMKDLPDFFRKKGFLCFDTLLRRCSLFTIVCRSVCPNRGGKTKLYRLWNNIQNLIK